MDAKYLLKAPAFLSAVVNYSSLWVKVSGREETVVFASKNLQNSFGFSLTELAREEIYSRFFDRIMFLCFHVAHDTDSKVKMSWWTLLFFLFKFFLVKGMNIFSDVGRLARTFHADLRNMVVYSSKEKVFPFSPRGVGITFIFDKI